MTDLGLFHHFHRTGGSVGEARDDDVHAVEWAITHLAHSVDILHALNLTASMDVIDISGRVDIDREL